MVTVYLFTIIFLVFLNFLLPRLLLLVVTSFKEEIAMQFSDAFKAVGAGWSIDLYGSGD